MFRSIFPTGQFDGTLRIPASKSQSQRVVACALLSRECTTIRGFGNSDDERIAFGLLEQSTLKPKLINSLIEVPAGNKLHFTADEITFGESGLSARMFTPILANGIQKLYLNGKGSLAHRSMHVFDEVFSQMGTGFSSDNGFLPFKLKGPLIPKTIELDGSVSSQFITGYIYAFAGNERTRNEIIRIKNPVSIPYIELSLDVLRQFGVSVELSSNEVHFNGPYQFQKTDITIEGDWSSASFLLVGAALFGSIRVNGLKKDSKQADKRIIDALLDFGAQVVWEEDALIVTKRERNIFEFDATHCPDLFPPLAVLGSFGNGISLIHGVHRLFGKESNRAETIVDELTKLGARIEIVDDTMVVYPRNEMLTNRVSSRHDHRIAMACAIFALGLPATITISDADAVNKSFPEFYSYLEQLTL